MKQKFNQAAEAAKPPGLDQQLLRAVLSGDAAAIRMKIAAGAAVDARNPLGHTPLMLACSRGDAAAAEALIAAGADLNAVSKQGFTALGMTSIAQAGGGAVLDLLGVVGADPFAGGAGCREGLLRCAVYHGRETLAGALLAGGADFSFTDSDGNTLLMLAAERNHAGIAGRLAAAGADLQQKDKDGKAAIFLAAERGSTACLAALLSAGADPNGQYSSGGESLLKVAAELGDLEAVTLLLEKGATVTPGQSLAGAAVRGGNQECLKMLLDAGADANEASGNFNAKTALCLAAEKGAEDMARLLLKAGARAQPRRNDDDVPLRIAILNAAPALVRLFLDAGADPLNLDFSKDAAGKYAEVTDEHLAATAANEDAANAAKKEIAAAVAAAARGFHLVAAAGKGDAERVTALLTEGIAPDFVNSYGETALSLACKKDKAEAVAALLARGADPNLAGTDKKTPLQLAAGSAGAPIVEALFRHGAAASRGGELAGRALLAAAVARDAPDLVAALIAGGARLNVKASDGAALVALTAEKKPEIQDAIRAQYGLEMKELGHEATRLGAEIAPLKTFKFKRSPR